MSLTFRKATPDDTDAVFALVESAYRGDTSRKGWTTEADIFSGDRINAAGVLAKITEPRGAVLLGYDPAGALVTCVEVLRRDDKVGYFGMFAVDPLRQGGGVGRQTLERVEEYVRGEWDARRLELNVIWIRNELIAWYERRGYRKTEQTKPFPYAEIVSGKVLRDDLYFVVLDKEL
ncbi:acyl-CoA N-acyltransferase [Ilyonectria robusta]|uniref:acyl-CoA N-acyltransferase n=1 Tax=Ilyonectria robusta TaxID=1079257 RepID=UPI001E8E62ED|nr:acyl-CoA N-acyltransferase [Ilyonectria robusta]KAH8721828.1 acyl-CoA N-acyltransferase [Ilyonectria robusta]